MKKRNLIGLFSLSAVFLMSTAYITPEKAVPEKPENDGKVSFAEFLSHFEKTDLPFSITLEELHKPQTLEMANSKKKSAKKGKGTHREIFAKYIPEAGMRFSRMGPPVIEPVARFYLNEKMIAVVYSSERRFGSGQKTYNLITYDLKGNIAKDNSGLSLGDGFPIAYSYGKESTTSMIDEKGKIWKSTYKNTWKKDFRKNGYHDNEIVDTELVSTELFQINTKGLVIEKGEVPVDGRAALD